MSEHKSKEELTYFCAKCLDKPTYDTTKFVFGSDDQENIDLLDNIDNFVVIGESVYPNINIFNQIKILCFKLEHELPYR